MSKETDMLRKFASGCNENDIPSFLNLHGLRDRVAFAIEAVEAQVAEAVARVEKLEAKFVTTTDKIEPAPVAPPAPRWFRVGDTITTRFSHGPQKVERIEEERIYYTRPGDAFQTWTVAKDATLVRAPYAPEAPAEEDTGLVVQRIRDEATKPLHVQIEKLRAKLAETERECAEQMSGVATKLHDAGFNNVENLVGAYRFERAQADALRFSARTWFNEKGEPELLATAEEVTERRKAAAKELAALKSKPRFRTRKVTKADVEDFIAHDGCFYESLRALGFRRRVDGAK